MKLAVCKLINKQDDCISILNWGARIVSWELNLGKEFRNIVLRYPTLENYLTDKYCLGASIGLYANRIRDAQFSIDGCIYKLHQNEGKHLLHGGDNGFHNRYWDIIDVTNDSVVLATQVTSKESGFPGVVSVSLEYRLDNDGALTCKFRCQPTKTTVLGPTVHPYFNLSSNGLSLIDHELCVYADEFTQIDDEAIPTGEFVNSSELGFFVGEFAAINDMMLARNIDHNFTVTPELKKTQAELVSPDTKIRLCVYSDYPGLQVYMSGALGAPFMQYQGVCLEPQFYPNSPNIEHFPFRHTSAGDTFQKTIVYKISKY